MYLHLYSDVGMSAVIDYHNTDYHNNVHNYRQVDTSQSSWITQLELIKYHLILNRRYVVNTADCE